MKKITKKPKKKKKQGKPIIAGRIVRSVGIIIIIMAEGWYLK